MINPNYLRTTCLLLMLVGIGCLRAAEVVVVQEDFEGGVLEELSFTQNANALLDLADDPSGGDRGKVGVIDLTGGAQWGALDRTPEQRVALAPLGISAGTDTYEMSVDFYLPEDTTMTDPDTIGVIVRWVAETGAGKAEVGNNKAISVHPVDEWFSLTVSGTIPSTMGDGGTVTHVQPIISFRDQEDDAGPAAVFVDNIQIKVTTSDADPNLNVSATSPFSTYNDLSTRTGNLSISNSGLNQTLTISDAKIQGDDAEHFELLNTIPLELPPGETSTLDIRFTPGKGAASYRGELVLTSNDSAEASLTIPLSALIIGDTGAELIINGGFESGSTSGFSSGQSFKTITDPVRTGEFAAVYEFAGGLQWGSVTLDQPSPISPEEGPTNQVRITEEMWEKEWNFSGFYSKPEVNGMADDDNAQFIIRWNGVQPDAAPFTNIGGAALTPGEWTEYTETGVVPTEWPPDSGMPVTSAYLILSFRDVNSDAAGGEQVFVDDWTFSVDGIELTPLPGDLIVTDVAFNDTDRSIGVTWTSQSGEWFDVATSTDLMVWTDLAKAVPASADRETTSFTDTDLGEAAVRYYRITRVAAPPFIETSFENGLDGWTVSLFDGGTETDTTWEVGTPTNGPASARTGDGVAGTDLDANYADATTIQLRSPVIDTAGETRVNLSFWYFLDALDDEGGQVRMLEEDGEQIAVLFDPFLGGEDNNTADWTQASVRLPDMDRPFIIEFQFLSQGGQAPDNGAGWFIDDIRVGK